MWDIPRLGEYNAFLAGVQDGCASFSDWRYAEAPSFADAFALELTMKQGQMCALQRAYRFDETRGGPNYSEPFRTLETCVSDADWEQLKRDMESLSLRMPAHPQWGGCDGTKCTLRYGSIQQYILFKWWSNYDEALEPVVNLANTWKDRLLALEWKSQDAQG